MPHCRGPLRRRRGVHRLGRFLTALGDPTRQRILMLLSRERLNVSDLAERFLSSSTLELGVSFHPAGRGP